MNTKDITDRQFETLLLLRALKEYAEDDDEFDELDDAVGALVEGESIDRADFIEDVYVLTEKGYVQSDADEENISFDLLPEIQDITAKGNEVLDNFLRETIKSKKKPQSPETAKLGNNYSLVNEVSLNFNLLGGMEFDISLFKDSAKLFKAIAKKVIGK